MATVTVISTFPGPPGPQGGELPVDPNGDMVVDASGNLFGTQGGGGANNDGAVFEVANDGSGYAGTPTILASFDGTDGQGPSGGLVADTAGNLFGVAETGGVSNDGTIFELANTANGYASTPTLLASFDGTDGNPLTPLIMDAAGDLFGMTASGGVNSSNTIFELAKGADGYASTPIALAQFIAPYLASQLVMDANGDLFATTYGGGTNGDGTVFEIAKTAGGYAAPTTVTSLSSADGHPAGGLVMDAAGNLFGVTNGGGANGSGEIFEIAMTAGGYASSPTALASFPQENDHGGALIIDGADNLFVQALPSGGASGGELYELPKTDGIYASTLTALAPLPFSTNIGLTGDASGNILGATDGLGQLGGYTNSTLYEVTGTGYVPVTASTGETLGAHDTAGEQLTGTALNDTFYAGHNSVVMTGDGGADTFIFPYLPWNAGSITDFNTATDKLDVSALLSAAGYTGSNPVADGYLQFVDDGQGDTLVYLDSHSASDPYPTLITTLDNVAPSNITPADYGYGSNSGGGATVSVISTFSGNPGPNGTLVVDGSGNLFGSTATGGANGDGAVFEVSNTGSGYTSTPTILASFDGIDGQLPAAGLIADAAGNLYGVTSEGGANGDGTIFELANSADGYAATPTVLASFDSSAVGPGNQLVMDAAGDLFGITENGPFNATVFELAKTADGYASAPTTLAPFNTPHTTSPLVIDAHGDLFGVALSKSGPSTGSVFEIANTANGYTTTPTTLATLGSADGTPSGALVADAAGDLFGLTNGGGANGSGEIFEIAMTANGYASSPTVLTSFPAADNHAGALLIDGAGDLFAQTLPTGGAFGGELFELAKTAGGYASTLTAVTSLDGGGASPMSGLVADADGHLFGTASGNTPLQSSPPNGTVWEITNTGFVPTHSGGTGQGETLTANDTAGQHLVGTPYDDIFYAGHNSVIMTGNGGDDTFVFPYEPWNAGQITDFTPGHDKLDLSALLTAAGYTGSDPVADGYITFSPDGSGDTNVYFNPHEASQQWPTLVTTLDGVSPTGLTSANTLGTAGGGTGQGETLTANDTAGQQLIGTPYDDIFYAGHNSVVMTGNGGADTFIFQYLPWNAGSITDFNPAADVLNLKGIFASIGYTGSNPVADGYLAFQSDGQGDTQVIVSPQGPGTQIPITVTTLDHVDPSAIHSGDYLFA